MSNTKPILFVGPLSEALIKLKGDIESIKESEGLEFYDMDELNEVNQVLPSLGTSFSIMSSPKKCANILQTNRNYIKANKLKIILLSPKPLPPKIVKKLEKLGLTECIIEPVPQKTLFYKAKIHIKAMEIFKKPVEDEEHIGASNNDLGGMEEQEVKSIKKKPVEFDDDLYGKKKEKKVEEPEEKEEDRTSGLLDDLHSQSDELAEERSLQDQEFDQMALQEDAKKSMTDLKGEVPNTSNLGGGLAGKSNFKEESKSPLVGKSNYKEKINSPMVGKSNFKEENKSSLSGKSNFKEAHQGNLEGDVDDKNKSANNLSGKSNFKEDEKSPLTGKNNFQEEAKGAMKGDMGAQNKLDGNMSGDNQEADQFDNLSGKSDFKEKPRPKTAKELKKEDLKSRLAAAKETYEEKKDDTKTEQAWSRPKELKKEETLSNSPDFKPLKKEEKAEREFDIKPLEKKAKGEGEKSKDPMPSDLGYSLEDEKKPSQADAVEMQEEITKAAGNLKYAQKGDLGEQTIDYAKMKEGEDGFFTDKEASNNGSEFEDNITRSKEILTKKMGESAAKEKVSAINDGQDYTSEAPEDIEAAPRGLDNLVEVFSFYFEKSKSEQEILNHIYSHIQKLYPCKFLVVQKINPKKDELIYKEGYTDGEIKTLFADNREKWEKTGLPTWLDSKFENAQNTFLFPLYTGVTPLGYAYLEFQEQVREEHAMNIEVTLEGLRGIYLNIVDSMNGKTIDKKKFSLNPFKKGA